MSSFPNDPQCNVLETPAIVGGEETIDDTVHARITQPKPLGEWRHFLGMGIMYE